MTNFRNPIQKGKQIKDEISVLVGGQVFDGWQSVSISENLESIANGFSIGLFDKFEGLKQDWPLRPGVAVRIVINNERALTGHIEKLNPRYTDENRGFTISGRSKPGDLVDCMHTGPNEYKNISLDKLAEELVKPFGLKVFLSVEPGIIDKFAVKPGETVFEALDRAARLQGFFFVSTRAGNIRLTKAATNEARFKATDNLEQDVNILEATADYDDSKRFSEYIVKGQTVGLPDFFGENASAAIGTAKDSGVTRHRPLEIVAEGKANSKICETRAQWEASSRLAKAVRATARVQGWTQSDGKLWGINQLTRIKSRFLGINQQMLIVSVERSDGTEQGKTTSLTLVDPQSYNAQPEVNKTKKDDVFSNLGANF